MTPQTRLVLSSVLFGVFMTALMIGGSGSLRATDVIIRVIIGVIPGVLYYLTMKSYAGGRS
jgi:uncharacterized YccA/Bax inhibitor family protein